jgi:hypothetical protein
MRRRALCQQTYSRPTYTARIYRSMTMSTANE